MDNLSFFEYEKIAKSTAVYPNRGNNIDYTILGLAGEIGEICEKRKKIIRDHNNVATPEQKLEMAKELGDVLWYLTATAHELGYSLVNIAKWNNEKLLSRKSRGKIGGSGDDR